MCALNVLLFFSLFLYFFFPKLNQFKFIHQLYIVVLIKHADFGLFELNKFVNFCQRYNPPSMCSKHENGFPVAHSHIANGNVTAVVFTTGYLYIYSHVFISDDFVFVNSSETHHYLYTKRRYRMFCVSVFFVVVKKKKKTKPFKIICFLCMFFYLFVFLSLFCSL